MQVLNFPSSYKSGETPYSVFKDRMAAITNIVTGIKGMIANKYVNNQMTMIADNILNKVDESKSTELIDLITGKPPEEIYPDNLEDTVGAFIDKFAMGPMTQKETMMGRLPVPTGLPAPATGLSTIPPAGETTIGTPDIKQLFSAISGMPSGDVNWANLFKTMTEKKPWFMGPTGPESIVMEKMMGQMKDPKAELEANIKLVELVQETFEAEKPTEWDKKTELFLQTDPTVEEVKEYLGGRIAPKKLSDFETKWNLLMQRDHTRDEEMKLIGSYVAGTTPVDIESIFANIPPGFELSSYNISTTGAPSFSFRPIDTTTAWEFDTWDEAKAFKDTHPQEGFVAKIETHDKGFDLTWYKKGVDPDELKPITPSDIKSFTNMFFGDESPGVVTPEDYRKAKDLVERTGKNFPIPEYMEIAETNLKRCLDEEGKIAVYEEGPDRGKPAIELYRYFYKYYKDALKGETPKYLPPELIEKTGLLKRGYGSALVDDYELDFAAMAKDGVTKEDIEKKMKEISER